ncbi:MAG: DUF5916 domain-containing protein [Pseudomonadales bacterium]|jgi:hypothetical protein|nr:DUF5916 domain-containing protein [Pseudomonadales bacterium]
MIRNRARWVLLAVAWLLVLEATAAAPARTGARPNAEAFPLTTRPVLDGLVLEDPAWAGVTPTSGFTQIQPYEGRPASQRTEVFIGYTKDALHVGVVAYDDDPSGIIVADSRRDSSLDETDSFRMIIDGFRDRQNGLVFGTNPVGIQYDGQVVKESSGQFSAGGGGFNLNWDTSWEVEARITELGWSAEFEIPFRSLRYGAGDAQTWGINFQRNIRRNNEITFWAPLDRQFTIARIFDAGTVSGIAPPPQRNLKLIPYALGRASRGDAIDGTDLTSEVGIDAKFSITPSLTLDATYNTDFAQVEVDDVQVNLDRFSLFFPEKRFFFLENAGQFSVGNPQEVEFFFSRRIGVGTGGRPLPIVGGLRLSGKVGDTTNVGLLHMRSDAVDGVAPQNDYSVARVSQELPNRSSIGAIVVNREGDGSLLAPGEQDYNRTYGVDGRWGIGPYATVSAWAGKTDTPGRDGREHAYSLRTDYNSMRWSNSIGYTEVGEDFNPEVGFLQRDGYRKFDFRVLARYRPTDFLGFLELRPHVSYRGFWDFEGYQETGFLHVDNHWEWRSGAEIHTGVNFTLEGVKEPFDIIPDVTVPVGKYDNTEAQIVLMSNEGAPFSASLTTFAGGFFGGDRVSLRPTLRYRIGETFTTELTWNHNNIDLPVDGGDFIINVGQLRLSYSFTPKILLQALIQYDDRRDGVGVNLRFSVLQSANAGLFLVYNEVDETGFREPQREFVLKYSHIFDVLR